MADINLIPTEYRQKRAGLKAIFSKTVGIILVLLILSLLIYGGLFIYKKTLTQKINDLNKSISELESKRDSKLENAIYKADKKLKSVENLFKSHLYWSDVFAKIEKLVVSSVYFTEMKINITDNTINLDLSGTSKNYTDLAQQMISFKEDEDKLIEKVELSDIKPNDIEGIDFTLSILVSEKILINQIEIEQ